MKNPEKTAQIVKKPLTSRARCAIVHITCRTRGFLFARLFPKTQRVKITLRCDECKQRNYNTVKNKKNTSDRLERSKYCPFCRKHTKHVETK